MKCLQNITVLILIVFVFGCDKSETDLTTYVPIPAGKFLDDWTFHVNQQSTGGFDIAEFRLWVPDPTDVSGLKAILVITPHFNGNGLGNADSEAWQEYARNNNIGLIGVRLKTLNSIAAFDTYANAEEGSGQALLTALEAIAEKNNIPEVTTLPFLLKGYSAGGMFSYFFSAFKPDRVIAFANIRGWAISTKNESKDIPGLMLIAEMDTPSRGITIMKQVVETNRAQNGLWSYAVEPNADHFTPLAKSDELIKLFFSSALAYRVDGTSRELLPISETSGWLGNKVSKNIFSYETYPDNKNEAVWLIDEGFANTWKDYQIE
ncbi:hypothetical protein [Aquimarina macrocephali]|uniref:hypothetical protein n=1 Tax=Aquimarina macrocephali TaxID=666563 RepID=UPI000466E1B6|nr:hypothetical protein [Aquimarina macrocephali]